MYLPFSSLTTASEKGATICAAVNQPKSPPFCDSLASNEFLLANLAKSPPLSSSAINFLASASVLTKIWRALYSVPLSAEILLSYSVLISASVTGFALM